MGGFWSDIRYGWRILRRNRGFAAVAVITLALGIGANAAIFSIVHAVLLRPLPFPQSNRVVFVWVTDAGRSVDRGTASESEYLEWRETNNSFQQMASYGATWATLNENGKTEQTWEIRTSANFFRMLRVKPIMGRDFTDDEETPGKNQVVLISHRFWQQRYGGNKNALGQSFAIDGKPYTIIGVLPAGFSPFGGPEYLDLWTPMSFERASLNIENRELVVFARLRDGVTTRQAQAEMETIQAHVKTEYPQYERETGIRVVRMLDDLNRNVSGPLLLLSVAVGLVLLIACANVANLMLARAAGRAREIAVRATIGASRIRILRQLLTESMTLAAMGGAIGILLGYGGLRLFLLAAPASGLLMEIPRSDAIRIDGPVLLFALAIAAGTGLVFGLAPVLQLSRSSVPEALKQSGRGFAGTRRSGRFRFALVVAEMALSVALLAAAGLLIHSFSRVTSTSLGFDPAHLLTAQVQLPETRYPEIERATGFYQSLIERASALPGVKSAAAVSYLPLTQFGAFLDFDIAGRTARPGSAFTSQYNVVSSGYLNVMGISLLNGRGFAASDNSTSAGAVLINRALEQRYWPNENPVGKQIRVQLPADPSLRAGLRSDWLTIVGVTGDIQDWQLADKALPMFYLPAAQNPRRTMRIVLRTAGNPGGAASELRGAVASLDAGLPVNFVTSMDNLYRRSIAPRRMNATLLGIFAAIATLLAAVGIYGVVSYGVSRRTHEIGIRLALGATPADVRRMVLVEGMRSAGIGLAIGLAGSLWLVRYLQSQIYGVSDHDPFTFALVGAGLLLIAAAACYIPARRATRVDPLVALREE